MSLVHHYFLQFIHLLDSSGEHILDVASEIDAERGLYSSPSAYSFSECHDYGLTFLPYQKLLKFLVVLRFPMTSRDGLDSVICTSNTLHRRCLRSLVMESRRHYGGGAGAAAM